jgi:hypothetical protein
MSEISQLEAIQESRRVWAAVQRRGKAEAEADQAVIDRAVADLWEVINSLAVGDTSTALEKMRDNLVALEAHFGAPAPSKVWP